MAEGKIRRLIDQINAKPPLKESYVNPEAPYSRYVISPYHALSPLRKPHYQFLTEWIKGSMEKDESILEIGCGVGLWGYYLKQLGYENYVGVDINRLLIEIGKEATNLDLRIMDGTQLKLEDNSFDFVGYVNSFFNYEKNDCCNFVKEALRVSRKWIEFDTVLNEINFAKSPTKEEMKEWLGDKIVVEMPLAQGRYLWIGKIE